MSFPKRTLPESGYQDPAYSTIINEHFDVTHSETRKALLALDEADQNMVLTSLTNKLYDNIVAKVDSIDYGDIPNTKGDITKITNYAKLLESTSLMRDIIVQYKQPTEPIDVIFDAITNVEKRRDLFTRAYDTNTELPMMAYCNLVLAIVSSVSFMISSTIEFVKSPKDETFEIALDRTSYVKNKNHLLYTTLKNFNKACDKGDFDKAMNAVMKETARNFVGSGTVLTGIAIGVGSIAIILSIIPILRELVFFFYYTKMRISDFFDIQADLLQMNAYNIENNDIKDPKERSRIAKKQYKIVEMFRKTSNTFSISNKNAEKDSNKEIKLSQKKVKIGDVVEEMPDSATSALF